MLLVTTTPNAAAPKAIRIIKKISVFLLMFIIFSCIGLTFTFIIGVHRVASKMRRTKNRSNLAGKCKDKTVKLVIYSVETTYTQAASSFISVLKGIRGSNFNSHHRRDLRRRSTLLFGRAWRGVGVSGGDGVFSGAAGDHSADGVNAESIRGVDRVYSVLSSRVF